MNEMQKKLLEILKWTDTFCRENDIRYYMVGGTMLGARRHKGFIPWDDDIDIGMPRADYERFYALMKKSDTGNYIAESMKDGNKDYVYPYIKIYDTKTTLTENTRYKTKRGLFIDVFPIDGVGNTINESQKRYNRIKKYINLFFAKICAVRKGRRLYKNISIILLRCLPEFLISHKKLSKKVDKFCVEFSFDNSKYAGNIWGNWGIREIMEKEIFGVPKEYDFEGLKVLGVQDSDKYLTNLYGDFMKLPPVEEQKTHHDFLYCNLEKSFLDN